VVILRDTWFLTQSDSGFAKRNVRRSAFLISIKLRRARIDLVRGSFVTVITEVDLNLDILKQRYFSLPFQSALPCVGS
jgi:hypothetical protein